MKQMFTCKARHSSNLLELFYKCFSGISYAMINTSKMMDQKQVNVYFKKLKH